MFCSPALEAIIEAGERLLQTTSSERLQAPALASRLEERPEGQARLLVENDSRFWSWGLVEELLARTHGAIFSAEPLRGVRLARLANLIAFRLDPEVYGVTLVADLRARSWAALGNAYRVANRFRAAAAALRQAADLLLEGTGDPLEEANLLSIRGSLAANVGDRGTARDLLRRAERIYEDLGEEKLLARVLVQQASLMLCLEPEEAIDCARRAEAILHDAEGSHLFLMARHNRVTWLIEAGRFDEAAQLFESSLHLYQRFEDPWTVAHRAWAEARLAMGLGSIEEAEACYHVLLTELLERGRHVDAALCALELAGCHLAQGNTAEASELAAAMAQHLREWGAHARAREAWAVLQHAISMDRATKGLLRDLASYLRRAWRNPRLAFQPALNIPFSSPIIRT